ncbi:DUF4244 domain-containing protein [Nonomuraea sp. NPDC049141]|uniref:DUF4244 domain-containing protein n=1 Tax=Nonomuraea sp. NPDC049141 TaxID=3155500 RepID=UPI00340024FE
MDLTKIVVGHAGDTNDLDYLMRLADTGATPSSRSAWPRISVDFRADPGAGSMPCPIAHPQVPYHLSTGRSDASTYPQNPVRAVRRIQPSGTVGPTPDNARPRSPGGTMHDAATPPNAAATPPEDRQLAKAANPAAHLHNWLADRWIRCSGPLSDRGMSTAEYAVGTIAACAFAAVLFKVVSSPKVQVMLSKLIDQALNAAG